MNKDDMILISVDDHIIEPPDMFENHLPQKYLADAPQLVHNPDGTDTWHFRDTVIPNVGTERRRRTAQGGVRPGTAGPRRDPARLFQRRRAGQGHERRRCAGAMNFPSFPGFAARLFATEDPDFSPGVGAGVQRLAHRRMVRRPSGAVHPDGIAGDLGCRAVRRGGPPGREGRALADVHRKPRGAGVSELPRLDYWNPLWKALVDTDTVMNVHIGSSGRLAIPRRTRRWM